jgi:prolyl-tRNA editing enzyme YbaK/EbsC (Cys-tRNA(Pro) deacylase)
VNSLEQAARERGLEPGQIVRSLLFRLEQGVYVLVLMPGPAQVSWPKLRHYLGRSRITLAGADEVRRVTGFEPGAVSPFGLATSLRILGDSCLHEMEVISLGAGMRAAGIILRRVDLERALTVEWTDLREQGCPDDASTPGER